MNLNVSNRDVSIINIAEELYLVVACDSLGAIGDKERDIVKVPPYVSGRFTCRVPLMELISVGAVPKALTATICNEPVPTGESILAGIRDELIKTGLDIPITISTEKNMPTCQTGLGVTIIGICRKDELRINTTHIGDKLYCVGIPKVGNEVDLEDPEIPDGRLVSDLLKLLFVQDIIPVGSKGIKGEADMLTAALGLSVRWSEDLNVDINKSSGPATCLLVTASEDLPPIFPSIHLLGVIETKN